MKWTGSLVNVLQHAEETRVAVAGDWHSNIMWIQQALPALQRFAPDVHTILHTGDFSFLPEARGKGFLRAVDAACRENGVERILVTPGNHEDWPRLVSLFAARPGEAVQLSASVWAMPRGYRFSIHGRTFMSFGGAASLDAAHRRTRGTWWPAEMPTVEEVAAAVATGDVEVLLTHETIMDGTARVKARIRANPMRWDETVLAYSRQSRTLITRLWEGVKPAILAHGHIHVADQRTFPTGERIYSLANDGQRKNIAAIDLASLA